MQFQVSRTREMVLITAHLRADQLGQKEDCLQPDGKTVAVQSSTKLGGLMSSKPDKNSFIIEYSYVDFGNQAETAKQMFQRVANPSSRKMVCIILPFEDAQKDESKPKSAKTATRPKGYALMSWPKPDKHYEKEAHDVMCLILKTPFMQYMLASQTCFLQFQEHSVSWPTWAKAVGVVGVSAAALGLLYMGYMYDPTGISQSFFTYLTTNTWALWKHVKSRWGDVCSYIGSKLYGSGGVCNKSIFEQREFDESTFHLRDSENKVELVNEMGTNMFQDFSFKIDHENNLHIQPKTEQGAQVATFFQQAPSFTNVSLIELYDKLTAPPPTPPPYATSPNFQETVISGFSDPANLQTLVKNFNELSFFLYAKSFGLPVPYRNN